MATTVFLDNRKKSQAKQDKYDKPKQWGSVVLFGVAVAVCCAIVVTVTQNAEQDILAIGTIMSLGLYSSFQYYQWRRETMETLTVLEEAEPEMREVLDTAIATKPELKPLGPIWEKLHAGRLHHQDILVHITSLQFALANTLIISSIGGAVAAFFILPQGWDNGHSAAHYIQKTLFLSFAVMATYCQTTPKVLSLASNLTIHLARYHAFLTLRWQLYRYVATGGQGPDGQLQAFAAFLNDFTQRLVELPPAPFGIDPSQVTSIAALAQQFSLSSAQNISAGAGKANPADGGGNQAQNGVQNGARVAAVPTPPSYSTPNSYRKNSLTDGAELATVQGEISSAVVSDGQVPTWLKLDAKTGAIILPVQSEAKAGNYLFTVQLATADGALVEAPVSIAIAEE